MSLTAFESRLGLGQGRIQPSTDRPTAGEWVFILGDEHPGRLYELAPGDYAEITQDVDLTDQDIFTMDLRLRVPDGLPESLAWEAQLRVDDVECAAARCEPGRERHLTDLAANVSKMSGMHTLGIRLKLVEV